MNFITVTQVENGEKAYIRTDCIIVVQKCPEMNATRIDITDDYMLVSEPAEVVMLMIGKANGIN